MIGALLAAASGARAQDADVTARLDYAIVGAERCPDRAAFAELVEARLGRSAFDDAAVETVEVRLEGGARVRGSVRWIDAQGTLQGERAIEDAGCAEVAESLAVAVGILLEDPPRAPEVTGPDPAPEVTPPPPAVVASPPVVAAPTPEEPGPPIRFELAASVHGGVGWTPEFDLGVEARVGLRVELFSAHLLGSIEVQPSTAVLRSGDRVDAFHGRLGIGGCVRPDYVSICLEAGGGAFQSTVHTVAEPEARTSASIFVGLRGAAHLELADAVALEPWVSVSILPLRPALRVMEENVWESSIVTGRLGFAVVGVIR